MANKKLSQLGTINDLPVNAFIHITDPTDDTQSISGSDYKINANKFLSQTFRGVINLATPTPILDGTYRPTQSGTYTNFGGLVVDLTLGTTEILVKDGVYTKIVTPIVGLAGYVAKTDVIDTLVSSDATKPLSAKQGKVLNDRQVLKAEKSEIALLNKAGESLPTKEIKINPELKIWTTSSGLDNRTVESWYKGVSLKLINYISVPIVRRLFADTQFTDSVIVYIGLNGAFVFQKEITLAEINSGGFNTTTVSSAVSDFLFNISIPTIELKINDELYIGITCKSATDKMGFFYTQIFANEWFEKSFYIGNKNIIGNASPTAKIINTDYSISVKFGYDDFIQTKINRTLQNYIPTSKISNSITEGGIDKVASAELVKKNYSSISLVEKANESVGVVFDKISPPISIYTAGSSLDHIGMETWYKGISTKVVNAIYVPIVRRIFSDLQFTDGLVFRLGLNGVFIFEKEITLSEINSGGFNATTISTAVNDFLFKIILPVFEIKANDVIYIALGCKSATDKMGFASTQNTTNEWGELRFKYNVNIKNYTIPPAIGISTTYGGAFKFSYEDFIQTKINRSISIPTTVISIGSRNINSFIGATNTAIDYLLVAKPRAKFAFISHHNSDAIYTGQKNGYCERLISAQQAIADYWGVPILRLDKKLGWIVKGTTNTLISNVPDLVHPGTDTTKDAIRQYKIQCVQFLKQFYSDYTGKKVAWYGTSIPWGYPDNDITTKYPDQAVAELGGTILNKSTSGGVIRRNKFDGTPEGLSFLNLSTTLNYKSAMTDLIGTANEPDLFIFDFGINDFAHDQTDFDFNKNLT